MGLLGSFSRAVYSAFLPDDPPKTRLRYPRPIILRQSAQQGWFVCAWARWQQISRQNDAQPLHVFITTTTLRNALLFSPRSTPLTPTHPHRTRHSTPLTPTHPHRTRHVVFIVHFMSPLHLLIPFLYALEELIPVEFRIVRSRDVICTCRKEYGLVVVLSSIFLFFFKYWYLYGLVWRRSATIL